MWPIIFQEKRIASEPWFPKVKELDGGEMWLFNHRDPDILRRYSADVSEGAEGVLDSPSP